MTATINGLRRPPVDYFIHNNQPKHEGMDQRWDWGGAWGQHNTIVLGAIVIRMNRYN